MLHFFRPAGLVQIALTFPVHKGEMFSLACPCFRTRAKVFEKTVTFAQEESLFFNLMQQNYCEWAVHCVVFVFYLCLFIDFCQHALPLPPHSLATLRQVVERGKKKKKEIAAVEIPVEFA